MLKLRYFNFGPISTWYNKGRIVETEVAGKRVRVAGLVSLGPSFGADGNLITKNSKVRLIIINSENDLFNYFRQNLTKNELVICMGAGSISSWIKSISQNEYFRKS